MRDRLLDFYRRNPDWIKPKVYMDDIVAQVENGLSDLSISRPSERLTWGIRVPDDDSQTIYVWLDALMNYLTYAGYPFTPGRERESIWPADVHVIGKDITRYVKQTWIQFHLTLVEILLLTTTDSIVSTGPRSSWRWTLSPQETSLCTLTGP